MRRLSLFLFLSCLFPGAWAAKHTIDSADINFPGISSSSPAFFGILDAKLIFYATLSGTNRELFKYDGSAASMAYDILPGINGSGDYVYNERMVTLSNKIYFEANNGIDGHELYSWDGVNNPTMVVDINPGANSSTPSGFVAYGNKIYFAAANDSFGRELWMYDPGPNTATRLTDLVTGTGSGSPDNLTVFNNKIYFSAYTVAEGRELFYYDPSSGASGLQENIAPGNVGSVTNNFVVLGNKLFFTAHATYGRELYSFDGTSVLRLTDINTGGSSITSTGRQIPLIGMLNNMLYFGATDGLSGNGLYKLDLTSGLASFVTGIVSPEYFVIYANALYFSGAQGAAGTELWTYDGINPPAIAADINPGSASSNPQELFLFNNSIVFRAQGASIGTELYVFKDSALGIKNLKFTGHVKLYPNPASDECYLQITLKQAQTMYVSLTDATGKIIYRSAQKEYAPGDHKLTIPMKELPAGNYYYQLVNSIGSTLAAGKVIKE
jgi:ELWxxDGT repeat protein